MGKVVTVQDRIDALAQHWRLVTPPGPGPFPLVIQLHGCGGRHPFQDDYAEVLVRAGVAALVLDSFAPRRIGPVAALGQVCLGLRLWGRERAGDVYAAFAWARRQPSINPDRIFAAGWSHGGWAVLDALAPARAGERARWTGLCDLDEEPLPSLAGAFVFYPYCGAASMARLRGLRLAAPVLAIVAGADSVVGGRSLLRTLQAMPKPGAPIETALFDRATHAFDQENARDPRFRFDTAQAARAKAMLLAFVGGEGLSGA